MLVRHYQLLLELLWLPLLPLVLFKILNIAAGCTGALAWILMDYFTSKKLSGVAFCSGALAGLVGITPACGYVAPWAALIIGLVSGVVCHLATHLKHMLGFDDALDAFAVHGIGGLVGTMLTGVFAQRWIALLDGTDIKGGLIDGNVAQILYQLISCCAIPVYAFFGTLAILFIINLIPGCHVRSTHEEELLGGDLAELGELAYNEKTESIFSVTQMPNVGKVAPISSDLSRSRSSIASNPGSDVRESKVSGLEVYVAK